MPFYVNQINLYQYINFTYKSKNKYTPRIFNDIIKKPIQQYQTQFSKDNFRVKKFSLRSTKYSVSIRGSKIWNEFFTHEEKSLESHRCFFKKSSLIDTENGRKYFWNESSLILINRIMHSGLDDKVL